ADSRQEIAVARVVICPSCQSKGSVPDHANVARIRCPQCGTVFQVEPAAVAPESAVASRPAESSATARAAGPGAGGRRSPTRAEGGHAGRPVLLYTVLGVSGLAVALLAAVLFVLLTRQDNRAGLAPEMPPPLAEAGPAAATRAPVRAIEGPAPAGN